MKDNIEFFPSTHISNYYGVLTIHVYTVVLILFWILLKILLNILQGIELGTIYFKGFIANQYAKELLWSK